MNSHLIKVPFVDLTWQNQPLQAKITKAIQTVIDRGDFVLGQALAEFETAFDPRFVGLTGSVEQIAAVAKDFKAFYQKVPTPNGSYTVDHFSGMYAFDATGRIRLFIRYRAPMDSVVADVKTLLKG